MRMWLQQVNAMAEFSNAQKLATVVSTWARPAICQLAAQKLRDVPFMRSLQSAIIGTGIVSDTYCIGDDIEPIMAPIVDSIVVSYLTNKFAQIDDSTIPEMAQAIVYAAAEKGEYSILGGVVKFSADDLIELQDLLEKNLPACKQEKYQIIK